MCRLLAVKSTNEFKISGFLKNFAILSQQSREFQGHGWGCAYLEKGNWQIYKNIRPIWEDDLAQFSSTTMLLAHARSAFRDEGITVENNMPFMDGRRVFIFNGELHGVKIKAPGRIGAEKIFNYIKRFDPIDPLAAIQKGLPIIQKRSNYIRAMNFIISDGEKLFVNAFYNEDHDYFTLYKKQSDKILVVCSGKFPDEENWQHIENYTIEVL